MRTLSTTNNRPLNLNVHQTGSCTSHQKKNMRVRVSAEHFQTYLAVIVGNMCGLAEVSGRLQIFTNPWNEALPDGATHVFSPFLILHRRLVSEFFFYKVEDGTESQRKSSGALASSHPARSSVFMTYARVLKKLQKTSNRVRSEVERQFCPQVTGFSVADS